MQRSNIIHPSKLTFTGKSRDRTVRKRKAAAPALWVSLASAAVLLPVLALCAAVISFQAFRWNLPNVMIYDTNVGWMTPEETGALVDRVWNWDRTIQAGAAGSNDLLFDLSPQELGYWVDLIATANQAYAVARRSDPLRDILSALRSESQLILPVLYFDESAARSTLEDLAADLDLPAQNASLAYQDGAWIALSGQPGYTLDIEMTLNHLSEDAFTNLITRSATLFFQSVPPDIEDLTPILDQIDTSLALEGQLEAYDPILDETYTWSLSMDQKRDWLVLNPDTYQVGLELLPEDVQAVIDSWEEDLGNGRTLENLPSWEDIIQSWRNDEVVQVTVRHTPTTYQVENGESLWSIALKSGMPLWRILDANPGLTTSNLKAGMTLTIPSRNELLPLPVVQNKRILIDISEQRMTVMENGQVLSTHLVSTGVSDSPTMSGIFQIQTHELNAYASNWDLYMPHFMGIYEAWPGFMNGIHGLPLLSNGHRLWASTLGSPASYGCIILDLDAAETLYAWAESGVIVEITH